ncbi:MAG TPA: RNA polymerase sigma factor [Polyangiaceae bacterium]
MRPGLEPQSDPLAGLGVQAARGDEAAIRTLLSTLGPHLLRIVRRVLGSVHPEVDDVAQECAIALISALPRWRGDSTLLHFACRVAVLTAMSVRRSERAEKRRAERAEGLAVEAFPSPLPAPDAELSARVTTELVRELLDSLPLEQAEVLGLHCVVGYTMPEIAAASGVPLETVRSRLRLAKLALRARVLGHARRAEISEESS